MGMIVGWATVYWELGNWG